MSGVLALSLAVFTTGCGIFESGEDDSKNSYYRPLNKNQAGGAKDAKGLGAGSNAGSADLQGGANAGPGANSGLEGANKPSEYGAGSGLGNTYDGFGTPIAGVSFNPVYFGFDQFAIGSGELSKINEVVAYLNKNPGTGVVIEGNCDNRGTEEYNRALGERRALAAQEQILAAGIASNRIKTISNGKSKLAAQGENEDSHRLNRRDEFIAVTLLK
ncbi:MAG: OmpA family protein [Lentisphaeria bacterium]|nr:OmpA family protein [Lentisphaeria bacterium]